MEFDEVMDRLQSFHPPAGWGGSLFLIPKEGMREIYDHVRASRSSKCLELGTGFGATSCVLAAAVAQAGGGMVTTVDIIRHEPVNVEVLSEHVGLRNLIEIKVDALGYNWHLAERIGSRTKGDSCPPEFDFCLLDGAHEFLPDALAFTLASQLLVPGSTLVLDDINFHLRQVPNWRDAFGDRSDRELDTEQIRMVWDLLVKRHPDFMNFRLSQNGRLGWATKRKKSLFGR